MVREYKEVDYLRLTPKQTLARLNCGEDVLKKMVALGLLKPTKEGGTYTFDAQEVDELARPTLGVAKVADILRETPRKVKSLIARRQLSASTIGGRFYCTPVSVAGFRCQMDQYSLPISAAARRFGRDVRLIMRLLGKGALKSHRRGVQHFLDPDEAEDVLLPYAALSLGAAAAKLGLTTPQLQRLAANGEIPFLLTAGGHRRFQEDDLTQFEDSVSVKEAAAELGISIRQFKYLAGSGAIPFIRTTGGHRRFQRSQILRYRAQNPEKIARLRSKRVRRQS